MWLLNPHVEAQATASIVKVDIMETLLHEAAQSHPLTASEEQLMKAMIEVSSNDDATSMWGLAGGPRGIASFNRLVGMYHTTPSNCVTCSGFAWPGWGLTTTTPSDQVLLLEQLVTPSHLLTTSSQRYALRLMSNIEPSLKWGVSDGPPPGASVAMKTGDVPLNDGDTDWQVNSIGWVDGEGHDYLLAMLSTGNPTLEYGIETLNEISALIWRAWNRHSAVP
jgi:hypothetical protein